MRKEEDNEEQAPTKDEKKKINRGPKKERGRV